jgi:cell division protein FtsN
VPRTKRGVRGGTVLGIFIGLILGLAIAAGVAFYVGRSGLTSPLGTPGGAKDAPRGARGELPTASPVPEKPRFDFYKILPGAEEPKSAPGRTAEKTPERPPDRATIDAAKAAEPQAKAGDRYWLQAGAFSTEAEAENLKARLALSGWEATMQSVTLSDKSTRYRVRLGPYDNSEQLNRMKAELGSRGFDVAVIKNP